MAEMRTEVEPLPKARERYIDYTKWLREQYGFEVDPAQAQVAVNRYHDFQASDFNQQKNAERIKANRAAREERAKAWEEKRARAAEKREHRESTKEEKAAAKAARAEARAAAKAERENAKGAAEASAPKRTRRKKSDGAEESQEATISAENVTFSAEGSKREMPEWTTN